MIHDVKLPLTPAPLHVLVAEDGLVNRRLAHGLLTREGYRVTMADNGAHAVSQLKQTRYDLVLMDVEMPVMDGLDATRAIRQHERTIGRHTPVIALTSNGNQDECLAAGMDGYLRKPFDLHAFRRIVSEILKGHAA